MTYLTQFFINGARRQARNLMGSPQAMHAAVMASFPPVGDLGRMLWRLDREGQHRRTLYIVSPSVPDLRHLVEQAGWEAEEASRTVEYDGLLSTISSGDRYGFRLRANPVHQVRGADGRSRKLAHVTVAQQLGWLVEREARLGISVTADSGEPEIVVSDRDRRTFRRGSGTVTIASAQYDGRLTVKDSDLLRAALVEGIGRAKAYGCGLMTIARLLDG